jgi:general secretion pathway protein D
VHRMLTFLCVLFVLASCANQPIVKLPRGPSTPWPANTVLTEPPTTANVRNHDDQAREKAAPRRAEYFSKTMPTKSSAESDPPKSMGPDGQRYELNFHDADVRTVIDAILGDMLHLNYVVSPDIHGKITFRTSEPIPRTSLLSALEAALMSVSAVIIDSEQSLNVVPAAQAPQRVIPAFTSESSNRPPPPGYAIEVVPLRYVGANEMKSFLESFVPRGTILRADETHGQLVVAGTSQERAAIMRTIASFDVNWLEGMHFAIYHLSERRPQEISSELKEIFQGKLGLFPNRVRLVSLNQIHAILGISRTQSDLALVGDWIRRLDVAKPGERRMYVYNVQNGSAASLVSALRRLMNDGSSTSSTPDLSTSSTDPIAPTTAKDASDLATNASHLVAIEETNSLLFYGTAHEYQVLSEALKQIDVLPRQVMIEAILAEVTLNNQLRYGVQWFFESGNNTVTLSATETGSTSSKFPGFSYIYSGSADARVVLNALQSETKVTILSAPKLSVLNNQKAMLQVGDQVPVVTQTSQSTSAPDAPVVNTVEMRDTGVILEVTPRVNENGNIILEVMQEVSEVAKTTSSGIDSPTIQQRKLHTVVATRDGYTVALGGLIRGTSNTGDTGIPILKDLPILGEAFKDNTHDTRRTELIVLLVPHVMRNQGETQAVVEALVSGLRSAADIANDGGALLLKREN